MAGLTSEIVSGKATDAEVLKTICRVHDRKGVIIDPHTAVAMKVGLEQRGLRCSRLVVAETAQPAKFADTIREALGFEPPVPKGYEGLADLPEHTTRIDPDPEVVKRFIASHVR
jgi:threonine synthase